MRFTTDQFEAFLHRHDALDLRPGGERFERLMRAFISNGTDDRARHAVDGMWFVAEPADFAGDLPLLFRVRAGFEDNDHDD